MHYTVNLPCSFADRISKEDEKLPNHIFGQLATDLLGIAILNIAIYLNI